MDWKPPHVHVATWHMLTQMTVASSFMNGWRDRDRDSEIHDT